MAKARLIVLAPVILAVGLAQPARGQAPAKKFITPERSTTERSVRAGGHGGKDPVHRRKGRLPPQRALPGEGRELPQRDPQDACSWPAST